MEEVIQHGLELRVHVLLKLVVHGARPDPLVLYFLHGLGGHRPILDGSGFLSVLG